MALSWNVKCSSGKKQRIILHLFWKMLLYSFVYLIFKIVFFRKIMKLFKSEYVFNEVFSSLFHEFLISNFYQTKEHLIALLSFIYSFVFMDVGLLVFSKNFTCLVKKLECVQLYCAVRTISTHLIFIVAKLLCSSPCFTVRPKWLCCKNHTKYLILKSAKQLMRIF